MAWNIALLIMSVMWVIAGIIRKEPSIWGLAIIMFWLNVEIIEIKRKLENKE